MATLTLINRVRAITASSTSHTSNDEVVEFVRQGVRYVLSALPMTLSGPFARSTSNITGNPTQIYTNKVFSVQRSGIKCIEVPLDTAYDVADTNSLHLATTRYPVFYRDVDKIFIKPTPAGGSVGIIEAIDTSYTAALITSTSVNSVDPYDGIAIKYAAALDYMGISGYWGSSIMETLNSTEVSTGARDALTNARDLIDNKTNYDAEDFLAEEDAEMVSAAVGTASQEVNRALAEMRGGEASAAHSGQMIQKAQELFQQADRELLMVINQGGLNDTARSDGESRQQRT
jgi:hypothetical protein